jgi:hypothetical protein
LRKTVIDQMGWVFAGPVTDAPGLNWPHDRFDLDDESAPVYFDKVNIGEGEKIETHCCVLRKPEPAR